MSKPDASHYKLTIEYRPGSGTDVGFFVTLASDGEVRSSPRCFASLRAAFKRGERVLRDAGFTTIMPGWDEVEL